MVADSLRLKVMALDRGVCAYCHTPAHLSVATFEIDHISPKRLGGEAEIHNLCFTCPMCNRLKGSKVEAVDPQSKQIAPLFHPRLDSWQQHFAWAESATKVVGLTPSGRATVEVLQMNRERMVSLRVLWQKMGIVLE